jgi:hypothetical protein
MDTVIVEAPEDSFIVHIAPEGRVAENQQLIALKSPKLEQQRSSLLALEEHLSFLERPFTDGRIDEEIAALVQKEQLLSNAVTNQTQVRDIIQGRVDTGHATLDELENAQIKVIQSQNSQIDAHLASSHAARKKVDMQDKIVTAKNKIDRDKQYLDEMGKALTIISGVTGTFYPNAFAGAFVRKGHVLGKINL